MKKRCPIKKVSDLYIANCDEEGCAWWNIDFKECIMMRMGRELCDIAGSLAMLIKR